MVQDVPKLGFIGIAASISFQLFKPQFLNKQMQSAKWEAIKPTAFITTMANKI
ncbi:hypothetical protein [Agarivorans sp. B2Z047]|uniref:hypothetical protein n=1 Tax=Agarivorans sp. B2Z047 TaxID=2652721 RepID=UPI00188414A5|nr:hypothetical protein [Agarivorans sp. B2Z047]UQN41720.1 hypothetical protein LQZ07_18380 [Agarivorans sp. B2Z047]